MNENTPHDVLGPSDPRGPRTVNPPVGACCEGALALADGDAQRLDALLDETFPVIAEQLVGVALEDPVRMRFAEVADRLLLEVTHALSRAGVSQEVMAASFDLSISGFRNKLKVLRERHAEQLAATAAQRTLIQRVYEHVAQRGPARVGEVLTAFRGVKHESVRAVLRFLVRTGYLGETGSGARQRFHAVRGLDADVVCHCGELDAERG
ncbi:MAG: hypothetical protein KC635_27730 [Myxococcales bacterium]|nr:hypothetical protein [Myxococcales bacterium]MCB9736665.1 hypothetical protein [Deltaproteobacteria bacterium]